MRRSTERPEAYLVKSSIKFDPQLKISKSKMTKLINKINQFMGTRKNWPNPFGNENASLKIAKDIEKKVKNNFFNNMVRSYDYDISKNYMNDLI